MKLQDCKTDPGAVLSQTLLFHQPQPEWEDSLDSGEIPPSLFYFYRAASYFSIDSIPSFLTDREHVLFFYLEFVTQGLRERLADAKCHTEEVVRYDQQGYKPFPVDKTGGTDKSADERQLKAFKDLVIALTSALDLFAEVVALLFCGEIPNLAVGRAQFTVLRKWADATFPKQRRIVPVKQHQLEKLHSALRPFVAPKAPEREWLQLMQLYRNKLAHMGRFALHGYVFAGKSGGWYKFLPRKWPSIWKRHIRRQPSPMPKGGPLDRGFQRSSLVQIDIVELAEGFRARVSELLEAGFNVLRETYVQFKDFAPNEVALESLNNNEESYCFERFAREDE